MKPFSYGIGSEHSVGKLLGQYGKTELLLMLQSGAASRLPFYHWSTNGALTHPKGVTED